MTKRQRREKARVQGIQHTQEIARTVKKVERLATPSVANDQPASWIWVGSQLTNRQLDHVVENPSKFNENLRTLAVVMLAERALKLEEER